jgi:rare lipoprotein A
MPTQQIPDPRIARILYAAVLLFPIFSAVLHTGIAAEAISGAGIKTITRYMTRPQLAYLPSPPPAARIHLPPRHIVVQNGVGSFYADKFHGRLTASGATMDQNAFTAASKELPLGTVVRVTNLNTGKSITVEINDRGPFIAGRVIDLSKRAAAALDITIKEGLAPVRVEAISADQPTPRLQQRVAAYAAQQRQLVALKTGY